MEPGTCRGREPRPAFLSSAWRPEDDPNIAWWLRLKGVRDIASGLALLAFMVWGGSHMVGIILLAEAIIAIGDMLVILAAKGSARSAFGMHGLTALLMILAGVTLTVGVA